MLLLHPLECSPLYPRLVEAGKILVCSLKANHGVILRIPLGFNHKGPTLANRKHRS